LTVDPGDISDFDVNVMAEAPALKKIRTALDLIYNMSEFSRQKIELLKKAGRVLVVYNPRFPDRKKTAAQLLLAVFKPSYFRKPGAKGPPKKDFLIIVSRLGIQWPVRELAAVLVHELVGHGIQHLRDRLKTMRPMDLECEAWMYQERAHQDLKLDKLKKDMVTFRVQLERVNCVGFRTYQRKNEPAEFKVWDNLNPDVDRLLISFERYLTHLRVTGETGRALKYRKDVKAARLAKLYAEGPPAAQFSIGMRYRQGIGEPRNDTVAAKWLKRAARQGHGEAKVELAKMFAKGEGVEKDQRAAKKLYYEAAKLGLKSARDVILIDAKAGRVWAQLSLGTLYELGRGVTKDLREAEKWYALAARNGNKLARERLKQLRN
ncbi:MAG: sel1 repeat family protein, partial [Rhodospirillales bacterium]|nr:sel1 repeat family protein [Rhodospirillales bacterium]